MTSWSDADLVSAALSDPELFAELYRRYADRLYRFALARTRSPATADDIVSETMIAALEQLGRFDPERGAFAAWLFTIASRRIADRGRAHRRFWRAVARAWRSEPPDDEPVDWLIRDEEERAVRDAVDCLDEDDREILLLRYSAGLTSTEIGDRLGITPTNARVRLQRARQRLTRHLGLEESLDVT